MKDKTPIINKILKRNEDMAEEIYQLNMKLVFKDKKIAELTAQLENSVPLPRIPYLADLYVLDHSDKKGNYIKKCRFTYYVIAPHPIKKGEFEGDIMYMNEKHKNEGRDIKEIGKTIFFGEKAKAEAEARLKELEAEDEHC